MDFCRALDSLGSFSTKMFIRFVSEDFPLVRRYLYGIAEINRKAKITMVLSYLLSFYTINPNLYEKISFRCFNRIVSTLTPIETKQETV